MTTRAPTVREAFPLSEAVNRTRLMGAVGLVLLALLLARAPLPLSVVALSGAGLVLATLVQPVVGLVALAAAIPFGDFLSLPIRSVNAIDLLVALVIAGWLAQGIARREVLFRPPPLLWPLAALLGIGALSLLQAGSWSEGVPELLKWVEFAAVYLVATQALDRRHVWWVVGALLAAGLVEVALRRVPIPAPGRPGGVHPGRTFHARLRYISASPTPTQAIWATLSPSPPASHWQGHGLWWRSRKPIGLLVAVTCGGTSLALMIGIGLSWSRVVAGWPWRPRCWR